MSKDCLSYAIENGKNVEDERRCKFCRYFDPTPGTNEGRCKFNPPVIVPLCEGSGYWPMIGDFESACSKYVRDWK